MTNETDLRECSAQIELIRQLIEQPETFDLDNVLIELETKKKLLMTFKPRSYITILKDLESGFIKHPGGWEPEKMKKVIKKKPMPKIDPEKVRLEEELQKTKDKLAVIEAEKEETIKEEGE